MRQLLAISILAAAATPAFPQAIRTNPAFRQTSITANDDGSAQLENLGFTLNFFGKQRSSVYVNNNGNLTFDDALATYTPFGLTSTAREIIAPFFADVDTRNERSKLVTYGRDTIDGHKAFGANFVDVGYFASHADKLNRFQVVLIERSDTGAGNFDIEFNYEKITWETGDASGGTGGLGGVPVTVGWSNGSGVDGTFFELTGSLISGSFLDNGPHALAFTRLNSSLIGRYTFRARDGIVIPPLSISQGCSGITGTVAQPLSLQLQAIGSTAPYTWQLIADPFSTQPYALSSKGLLTGTSSGAGHFEFTVKVTANDEQGPVSASQRCSVDVVPPIIRITSACPLPQAMVGSAYRTTLRATGPPGPFTWNVPDPSGLPSGIAVGTDGTVSGTPQSTGIYSFSIRASDGAGSVPVAQACSLAVIPPPVSLVGGNNCPIPDGTVGVPVSLQLSAAGGRPPYQWLGAGSLPAGLSLSASGLLAGTPRAADTYPFQLQLTDQTGQVRSQACSMKIAESTVKITSSCPLPDATYGVAFRTTPLMASGGSDGYAWTSTGSLPPGITLSRNGVFGGAPSAGGAFSFGLVATDRDGSQGSKACSIRVNPGPMRITSCPLPAGTLGQQYAQPLNIEGDGVGPFRWSAAGPLPRGIEIGPSGRIFGTPTQPGSFDFYLLAKDVAGREASQPCHLDVPPEPLRVGAFCPLPTVLLGQPYSFPIEVFGGIPPYQFTANSGLPPGLRVTSDGTLIGLPTAPGDYSFGITAADSRGLTIRNDCTVAVRLPDLPTVSLRAIPASVDPAVTSLVITLDMSRAYSLPITGTIVIDNTPDTGSPDSNLNRADPSVRFRNGQTTQAFTIPPGTRTVTFPITSTGTVAANLTFRITRLEVAGTPSFNSLPSVSTRVNRAAPTLTSACYASTSTGIEVVLTGFASTREVTKSDLTVQFLPSAYMPSGTFTVTARAISNEYFSADESVASGGAFTLRLPFSVESGANSIQSLSVTVTNALGTSAARSAGKCQ
ncbi:MAG: putative Ig domain-containing protein [Bryobacteraceae bacterium]